MGRRRCHARRRSAVPAGLLAGLVAGRHHHPGRPAGRGGRLRAGIVGGSAKDSLDAHRPVTHPDEARVIQLYDTLAYGMLNTAPEARDRTAAFGQRPAVPGDR